MQALQDFFLFDNLSEQQIKTLNEVVVTKKVNKNTTLFSEGEVAHGFYAVCEGLVRIFKIAPDGRECTVHIINKGQIFAEVPLFRGKKYPASAQAIEESLLLFFPRQPMLDLFAKDSTFALNMLATVSEKMRMLVNKVESLTLHEAPQRIALYLLHLSFLQNDTTHIVLDLNKSMLANMLGIARETLSRILSRLIEQGCISMEGREIVLLQKNVLENLANGNAVI